MNRTCRNKVEIVLPKTVAPKAGKTRALVDRYLVVEE